MDVFPYAWIFFITFILLVTFIMINLFIGIIVDAIFTIKEENKEADKSQPTIQSLQQEVSELKLLIQKIDNKL